MRGRSRHGLGIDLKEFEVVGGGYAMFLAYAIDQAYRDLNGGTHKKSAKSFLQTLGMIK